MEKYTKFETNYLIDNYANSNKNLILANIHRSWHSIQKKAAKLKIKRLTIENHGKNFGKYARLLNDETETYYWLGLLIADGHFDKRGYITISLKDKDHVNRFRSYLGMDLSDKDVLIISDRLVFKELTKRFIVSNNKTYEPCDLSLFDKNEIGFFSFIIGFIDGDGSINKKGEIKIKCHSSWINNVSLMLKLLDSTNTGATINSEGLSIGAINKTEICRVIKKRALIFGLPLLERKWVRIHEDKLSIRQKSELKRIDLIKAKDTKQELANRRLTEIKNMLNLGFDNKTIYQKLNISSSIYYKIIKANSIKAKDAQKELKNYAI